jgi:hypothetical protein
MMSTVAKPTHQLRASANFAAKNKAANKTTRSTRVRAAAGTVAAPAGAKAETIDDCINTVRFLAIAAINKSNSGHPGLPMGCAPMGYVIFREAMTHNPKNTKWFNRDRFVLSAGHGCMLQYSLMHLTGYPSVSVRRVARFDPVFDARAPAVHARGIDRSPKRINPVRFDGGTTLTVHDSIKALDGFWTDERRSFFSPIRLVWRTTLTNDGRESVRVHPSE